LPGGWYFSDDAVEPFVVMDDGFYPFFAFVCYFK